MNEFVLLSFPMHPLCIFVYFVVEVCVAGYGKICELSLDLKGCGLQPHRISDLNDLRHGWKPCPFKAGSDQSFLTC
jgi:hypothetical protein